MAKKKLTIGEQIKAGREAKDLSRAELGLSIGKTQEYIAYIERNERHPRKFDRKNIEEKLGIVIVD